MKLDCTNLDCPIPVLRTKEALESMEEGILDVELNSYSSIENVKRFVKSQGLFFEEKQIGKAHIILSIVKGYECGIEQGESKSEDALRAEQIAQIAKEKQENRRFWTLLIGAVVSAILASTCCLGPLLFLIFGISVGSLGFLKAFAPYHTYFSIGAIAVVGYLWFDWFWSRRDKVACATSLCKNYTLYLGIGTIFVAILVTYPFWIDKLIVL